MIAWYMPSADWKRRSQPSCVQVVAYYAGRQSANHDVIHVQMYAEPAPGTARLVGGREDVAGAWAYGQLKVFDGNIFSSISDNVLDENFGRRGAQVACRSLGFSAGAQFDSLLPITDTSAVRRLSVQCRGDEVSLSDCEIDSFPPDSIFGSGSNDIVLLCSNPSGV